MFRSLILFIVLVFKMSSQGASTKGLINSPEPLTFEPLQWGTWTSRLKRSSSISSQSNADKMENKETPRSPFSDHFKNFDSPTSDAFDGWLSSKINLEFFRSDFSKRVQEEEEPIDKFISDLQIIADKCDFGTVKEEIIRFKILAGMRNRQLSHQLQLKGNLSLRETIRILIIIEAEAETKDQENCCEENEIVNEEKIWDICQRKLEDKKVQTDADGPENFLNPEYSIEVLNDDCLLHIFSYLPARNRIVLERVSKRWRRISLESWRSVKKIDVCLDFRVEELSEIEEILRRGGDHLTALSFFREFENDGISDEPPKDIIELINKYCKKLSDLNLRSAFKECHGSYLNYFDVNILQNLKTLSLGSDTINNGDFCDEYLPYALQMAVNLEKLEVEGSCYHDNIWLNLSEKCKTLCISYTEHFSNSTLVEILKKYQNLENLDISDTGVTPEALFSAMDRLRKLSLSALGGFFFEDDLVKELRFPNLLVLHISNYSYLEEDFLSTLIENCPMLEDLRLTDLRASKRFFINGINSIKELKNLLCLDVSNTDITGEALITLSKRLKTLNCYKCPKVASFQLKEIIATSPKLTYLAISSSRLYPDLVKSALESVQNRNNRIPLTISIRSKRGKIIVPALADRYGLKYLHHEGGPNFLRLTYGEMDCVCFFDQPCCCLDQETTLIYYG